jgi:hypothetical protein
MIGATAVSIKTFGLMTLSIRTLNIVAVFFKLIVTYAECLF